MRTTLCGPARRAAAFFLLTALWPAAARAQEVLRWGADPSGGAPYIFADPAHPEQYIGYEKEMVEALAAGRPCGALVLESGLSSAADMARVILPWLPRAVARQTRNKFDTVAKLPRARCPVLVAHGDRDEVIPVEQGQALYAAAPEPKRLHLVRGAGHNNLNAVGGPRYLDAVADFIRSSIK